MQENPVLSNVNVQNPTVGVNTKQWWRIIIAYKTVCGEQYLFTYAA